MSSSLPRIAIVGGGPGGLTAGVLLHKHGVPFTIFELRQKPTVEELAKPVGVLDLHEETGLAAIRKCGLYDAFLPLTGECASVMSISDKDGNVLFTDSGEDRPEISRNALNQLLASNIPAEVIKWGHKLISAASFTVGSGHTETELDFGVHGKHKFDLVIGADGAWSKVRILLTDVKPRYSGIQIMTATIRNVKKKYPHLAEMVGSGTFFALGNGNGVTSQRGSQDSARIYIFITTPDEHFATTSGLGNETAALVKDRLLNDNKILGQWGARIKELVSVACDEETADNLGSKVDLRPVCGLPIGHTWEHKPGSTLIGDAAHLMPPSGEGVNLAMWDAMRLSEAIIKAHETTEQDAASFQKALGPLMKEFEIEMAARAKDEAEQSRKLNETLFAEDGAKLMAEWFKSFRQPPE